jgi:hypothetical protein
VNTTKDERRFFTGLEAEVRDRILGLLSEENGGIKRHRWIPIADWRESRTAFVYFRSVPTHRIIKAGLAPHLEIGLAPDHRYRADNLIRPLLVGAYGHIVCQLSYTLFRKKPRD